MPQEPTSLGPQGSPLRLTSDPKTTGVPAQASMGTCVGVQRCAQTETGLGKTGIQDTERLHDRADVGAARQALNMGVNSQTSDILPNTSAEKMAIKAPNEQKVGNEDGNKTRRVDIGALNEEELLEILRGYINSMTAFSRNNRNVHKELKESLTITRELC